MLGTDSYIDALATLDGSATAPSLSVLEHPG